MERVNTAHANFRKGLTDYNDGENVTSHLGNDEYPRADLKDPNNVLNNPYLEGKFADGNDFLEEFSEDEEIEDINDEELNYE